MKCPYCGGEVEMEDTSRMIATLENRALQAERELAIYKSIVENISKGIPSSLCSTSSNDFDYSLMDFREPDDSGIAL